jgi:probable DNA repair protein
MGLDDGNQAYERICESVCAGALSLPFQTLVLAGFNEVSPRLGEMLEAMRSRGIAVFALERASRPAGDVRRLQVPDPDSEWTQAAAWAARQLAGNPSGRYAIIAARLEADVVLAHRCLRAALSGVTGQAVAGAPGTARAFAYNIAVARPMAEWPLARAALAWLHVLAGLTRGRPWAPEDLGAALLAGGCAGGQAESAGRAAIDAYWRRRKIVAVSEEGFCERLAAQAPRLGEAWKVGAALVAEDHAPASADVWARRFRQWLEALGFPGRDALDSHAYQVVEAFDRLLDAMARLSFVAGALSFGAAVALLRRLARETPFQPQRDPDARLDVLGFLESEGGRWDAVWVLGLTDEVLPAPPKPNPFIPLAAQREAGAPRATPERELHWAKTLYGALLECAPVVVLSHPQYDGERLLRPSPCIADVALTGAAELSDQKPAHGTDACPLELLVDDRGPALQPGAATRGGIGVIDTQARNPLWAFAKYRLGASELPAYAEVFNQNNRGELLHRAVEIVWRMLQDQEHLHELAAQGSLAELVEQAVEQAAEEFLANYGETLRLLETGRAKGVVLEWLDMEMRRTPFAVKDVEHQYEWRHGPLALTLRLDRIDSLVDGRLAVIDYKSGGGTIDPKSDWMRARPVSLQLPFYASVLAEHSSQVGALVLARLHAREVQVRGLEDGDYGFEGAAALDDWPAFKGRAWEEVMGQWRQTIEQLAQEYVDGVARNTYVRQDDLRYCDVRPFLRLTEEYPDAQ